MIDPISTIELKKSILEDNDADAENFARNLTRGAFIISI